MTGREFLRRVRTLDLRVRALEDELLTVQRYSYILKERYVCGKTWQHIAEQMYLDRRWVFRLHKGALDVIVMCQQMFLAMRMDTDEINNRAKAKLERALA